MVLKEEVKVLGFFRKGGVQQDVQKVEVLQQAISKASGVSLCGLFGK